MSQLFRLILMLSEPFTVPMVPSILLGRGDNIMDVGWMHMSVRRLCRIMGNNSTDNIIAARHLFVVNQLHPLLLAIQPTNPDMAAPLQDHQVSLRSLTSTKEHPSPVELTQVASLFIHSQSTTIIPSSSNLRALGIWLLCSCRPRWQWETQMTVH